MTNETEFATGVRYHESGDFRAAEKAYRTILATDPSHSNAWQRLGILLHQTGRTAEGIEALEQAARLRPEAADIQSNLGAVLAAGGFRQEAIEAFGRALALGGNFPETHNNVGNLLKETGRLHDAADAYRQAARLRPEYPDAWNSLGSVLRIVGDLDAAEEAFGRAIQLRPDWPESLNNLAGVYQETRRIDQAVVMFRRALAIKSDPRIWDNLLLAMYGQEGVTGRQIREAHDQWNRSVAAQLEQMVRSFPNDRLPDRPLRIGYVSPDFREHPVGYLMTPVLTHHDRSQFEVFCYSDVKAADAVTRLHRSLASHWIDVTGLNDVQLVSRIEQDRIDVLIDLTLHTANNRLLAFARRPAPVQLTWAGYPGSTGLHVVDCRLTDPRLDPSDLDRDGLYSEKLTRLPNCFWCFDPRSQDPPINGLPAERNGAITFGSLNQFGKITDGTLTRWAGVMNRVENSRLRILAPIGRAREALTMFMEKLGVSADRISFMDRRPRGEYLELYHDIDVCLDTFPYTGHTTTIDALWMGVPVVTRFGETAVSRGGLSVLTQVGLQDLCATTDEDFIVIAGNLAGDRPRLGGLRSTLRNHLMDSPIADTRQFTRDIESAIRFDWRTWCGQ